MVKDSHFLYESMEEQFGEKFIKNFPKLANHISDFINKRTDVLSTKNVGARLFYTKAIENEFFEALDIERDRVITIIKNCKVLVGYNDEVEPIYNVLMILSCFYEVHQAEMEKLYGTRICAYKFVRLYLGLRIYSICQRQIFKYVPKEDIMEYVISHLNNRYDIAKLKNIYVLIEDYVESNNKSLEIDFKIIRDNDVYQWVSKMIRRFKSMLTYIYAEFDKARIEGKKTVTEDIENTNGEGKKYLTDTTSVSNTIENVVKTVIMNFIQDSEVRRELVRIACRKCNKVSEVKATLILNNIRKSSDGELMSIIIKDIVSYWIISLQQDVRTVHSIDFIKRCSSAYAISNTYDVFISDLKEKLNVLVTKYSSDYIDTEKRSTLNSFKQVVFLYMVFYISSLK